MGSGHRSTGLIATASAVATAAVLAGALAVAWRFKGFREMVGVKEPPPAPTRQGPSLRKVLIAERDAAAQRGDLQRVAMIHAALSSEAKQRAAAVQRAWLRKRDTKTLLFPESPEKQRWNYRNTAADCFGFLIHAAFAIDDGMPALKQTLAAETKLTPAGQLCQPVEISTGEPIEENHQQRIFGASEYVKDGLLSIYERWGADPVGPRMIAVLDAILANSQHTSKFGALPGGGSEENGNVLQACSRLSFALARDDYAEMAARITDAAVTQMLPINNGVPAMRFDYSAGDGQIVRAEAKTRDHGSEIVPGLAESFAMAVGRAGDAKWKERADRWAEPIARMYEVLLTRGADARGLLISGIDPANNFKALDAAPSDNWGYVLNGVLLFTQAARQHGNIDPQRLDALDAKADAVIDAVVQQYGIDWEFGHFDGYADTLESAIYMAAYRPTRAAGLAAWIDDQIELMFDRQRDDGFITEGYLDGNFIRTALMYAEMRSGGWRVEPWRSDVRVGFASNDKGEAVVVVLNSQPYKGTLHADEPRHRTIMKLPWNWPRLNSWPEWFVVDERTRIMGVEGLATTPDARELTKGLALDLPASGMIVLRLAR